MIRLLVSLTLAGLARIGVAADGIAADEELILFPALGRPAAYGGWDVSIHGWIFEPERDSFSRAVALALLAQRLDLLRPDADGNAIAGDSTVADRARFDVRAAAFLVDNERGKRLHVDIGGRIHALGPSQRNGHLGGIVHLPAGRVEALGASPTLRAGTRPGDGRTFTGDIVLVPPTGISVVTDLDDTLKISEVRDRRRLIANTFIHPYRPVDGMAAVFRDWAGRGAIFHVVTASPWQLYAPLAEFWREAGFPSPVTWHMKPFRWKDETFWDLFLAGDIYKRRTIEPLLTAFPDRRFVLVGDSGEGDPEAYADLARRYPDQVVRVLIRDVSDEPRGSPRYAAAFADLPDGLWTIFTDPGTVADHLP